MERQAEEADRQRRDDRERTDALIQQLSKCCFKYSPVL